MSLRDQMMASRRLAGEVIRFHCWPTIRKQTVAEHSWQVMRVYTEIFGVPPVEVWEWILWHDVLEFALGDPPWPTKIKFPQLGSAYADAETTVSREIGLSWPVITETQRKTIKLCDNLECWEFGKQEVSMGNKLAMPILMGMSLSASKIAEELGVVEKVQKWQEFHI